MTRLRWFLMLLVVVGATSMQVEAATFVDFIDFNGVGLGPGLNGSLSVFDNAPPLWVHDLTDDIVVALLPHLTDAELTVSYRGTGGNESWSLVADGLSVGSLLPTETAIFTTSYTFDHDLLDQLKGDGMLNIVTNESTSGRDGFRLYESTLTGHYEVLPEPSTMLLWAPCLVGLIAGRFPKKRATQPQR